MMQWISDNSELINVLANLGMLRHTSLNVGAPIKWPPDCCRSGRAGLSEGWVHSVHNIMGWGISGGAYGVGANLPTHFQKYRIIKNNGPGRLHLRQGGFNYLVPASSYPYCAYTVQVVGSYYVKVSH